MTTYVSPFTGDVIQPTDVSYRSFTLSSNTTLSWPINGNATGNYAARIMEVLPTTSGLSLLMPPANQTSVGTDSLIRNLGASSFTVKDNSGGTIITIAAGEAQYIYVTNNSSVAGTWGIIAFGAGTSSADAATLAGYGLLAISTTLNQSHPASNILNAATFAATDRAQTKIWSSGAGTATLPAAATLGDNWFTIFKNNGTGTFTISTTGVELIDGGAFKQYGPGEASFIICTGTEYVTVGYGTSSEFVFNAITKPVVSGSYTLTPSEASNIIQEYVGTLSGNVTVTYPPVVNLYVISNQTIDNGYTLTVTTGISGSFAATIPPGQQATLVCDGTNFFNANTVQAGASALSIVSGNAGNPGLNFAAETNTGIYRGGTGQFNVSVLGTARLQLTTTGLTVTGAGTFTTGISGGTF
jgi:hypothetical protein